MPASVGFKFLSALILASGLGRSLSKSRKFQIIIQADALQVCLKPLHDTTILILTSKLCLKKLNWLLRL